MGQGPCGSPLRFVSHREVQIRSLNSSGSTDSNPSSRRRTPSVRQNTQGILRRRRAGKVLDLALPTRAQRGAMPRGLARMARRTARSAKGQVAALHWGALAGARTRARVLVHGRAAHPPGNRRRDTVLPVRRGVAPRVTTCKHTRTGRSPAHT
jgi:hypothetical protein